MTRPPKISSAVLAVAFAAIASAGTLVWFVAQGESDDGEGGVAPLVDACSAGPGKCPDLRVDLANFAANVAINQSEYAANACAVREGLIPAGTHKILEFSFLSWNLGSVPIAFGSPFDRPDIFEYAPCHEHFHFKSYADFRLWTEDGYAEWKRIRAADPGARPDALLAANPTLRDSFVAGRKQGFCLIDTVPPEVGEDEPEPVPRYTDCDRDQGLSATWGDEYPTSVSGQWIVIDDVPPGWYILEGEVNGERLIEESDYSNNAVSVRVRID